MNNKNHSDDESRWSPVFPNAYEVSGTARKVGDIGKHENFQKEIETSSSRNAYVQARDELYNTGYEHVRVVAVKMKCEVCDGFHVIVPPELYLY